MQIILIAAMAKNRTIGYQNKIPWKIRGEQKLFKEHTLNHAVVMGRKTYESIGKPLPDRKNIIITSQQEYTVDSAIVVHDIDSAIQQATEFTKVFIIGGAKIYQQCLAKADYIYLTIIDREIRGDAFFPKIPDNFKLHSSKKIQLGEPVTFNIYKKIGNSPPSIQQ